jgi:hypothetical protein
LIDSRTSRLLCHAYVLPWLPASLARCLPAREGRWLGDANARHLFFFIAHFIAQ